MFYISSYSCILEVKAHNGNNNFFLFFLSFFCIRQSNLNHFFHKQTFPKLIFFLLAFTLLIWIFFLKNETLFLNFIITKFHTVSLSVLTLRSYLFNLITICLRFLHFRLLNMFSGFWK